MVYGSYLYLENDNLENRIGVIHIFDILKLERFITLLL